MKKVPTAVVKSRSRRMSTLVDSFGELETSLVGSVQRCWVVDTAADGCHRVGHTKSYVQVLLPAEEADLGSIVVAKITEATRWSCKGRVLETVAVHQIAAATEMPPSNTVCRLHAAMVCNMCSCPSRPLILSALPGLMVSGSGK